MYRCTLYTNTAAEEWSTMHDASRIGGGFGKIKIICKKWVNTVCYRCYGECEWRAEAIAGRSQERMRMKAIEWR